MGFIHDLFFTKTKDWLFAQLPAENAPALEIKQVKPREEYLNIYLKSMRIVNVRKGLSTFYAAVHSHVEVAHLSGKPANFNSVSTPNNLEKLDGSRVDRVLTINNRLVGPVPYRGGDVKLEVGLFSIKESDLAEPFIRLLTSMSTLAGVSFIGTALPYVKPLEDGIELLTGSSDDTILEIGLNLVLNPVTTGYYVVMRAEKGSIDPQKFHLDPVDYKLYGKDGKPIQDFPYMVFEISTSKARDEWFNIPDLSEAFNKLQAEVQKGDYNAAKNALNFFRTVTLGCPDLLFKDALLIYGEVEKEIQEMLAAIQTSSKGTFAMPNLQELKINFN